MKIANIQMHLVSIPVDEKSSEMKKVAILAEAHKVDVAPHMIGTSIALAVALQFIGSIPNGLWWNGTPRKIIYSGRR